jgi:hypothetical protein
MTRSTKIIIGLVIAVIVIWIGYMVLNSISNNTNHVILQGGSPYDPEHLQRTLNSGGVPGDGGGG